MNSPGASCLFAALGLAAMAGLATVRAADREVSADVIAFAEFTIGSPLDQADRRRLADLVAQGFDKDPASRAGLSRSMANVVSSIRTISDEAARATTRKAIATRLYWDAKQADDPVARLIVDRAGVVAAVSATGAVLRQADIDGVCRSSALGQSAMGQAFDREDCRSRLLAAAGNLTSLDPGDQEVMVSGERRAVVLEQYWRTLAPARRAETLALAKRRAGSDDPLRIGRALETSALSARLEDRMKRYVDAVSEGLAKNAAASRIGSASQGF